MRLVLQRSLRVTALIVIVGVFAYYLWHHPEILRKILRTPAHEIVVLVCLYLVWFGGIGLTLHATFRICNRTLGPAENILLNAYSTLVNFFVPGQGGVAVRGLYMKKQHQLGFRHYILATLLYYASYALVSAVMLLVSSRPWWQTSLGIVGVVAGSALVITLYERRTHSNMAALSLHPSNLLFLLVTTVLQVSAQVAIYGYEIHTINADITLSQIVTYAGAANFSVFVALTPGAIGIRESFLLLSKKLHHIDTSTILAASVLDRAVFLIFLGLLFAISQVFHARKNLRI